VSKERERGIPLTNHVTDTLTQSTGTGLFYLHSLLNHSCNANAKVLTNGHARAYLSVRATRAISAGEQITIDYLGLENYPPMPAAERHALLGFECHCLVCTFERTPTNNNTATTDLSSASAAVS